MSTTDENKDGTLSGKARRHLRALGHHLQAVVLVGKEGLTPALVAAVGQALSDHELIKVKLGENADGDRHDLAGTLAAQSGSALVGQIGRTVLLYRRNPKKPKIALPTDARTVDRPKPKPAARALPRKPARTKR